MRSNACDSTEIIYLPTASGPMPIAVEINGRLYAIHTDHLNTPRRLTNQQGQVAWQWLISGFGEVRPTTGDRGYGQTVSGPSYAQAVKFDLRYPGQVFDEETGCRTTCIGTTMRRRVGICRRTRSGWRVGGISLGM